MHDYEKVFIYFDTNILECRHSGNSLYLSQFTISPLYFEIERLILDYGIADKTMICIPEIVWLELKEHLLMHFKNEKAKLLNEVNAFKKSFGNLIDLTYEFKGLNDQDEYMTYLHSITRDFLDNPKVNAKIISCPKDEETVNQIIQQAIHCEKPFKSCKVNGKSYSDAGFKDALIFNTILRNTKDQMGIFVSNDSDFECLFNKQAGSNLFLCRTLEEVKDVLTTEFNIITIDVIKSRLYTDEYLLHKILKDTGFDEYLDCLMGEVVHYEQTDYGYQIKYIMIIDNEEYLFDVLYNVEANELLEVSCDIYEKEEEN